MLEISDIIKVNHKMTFMHRMGKGNGKYFSYMFCYVNKKLKIEREMHDSLDVLCFLFVQLFV